MSVIEHNRTNDASSKTFRGTVVTSTEARRGVMTTEFWLSVVLAAVIVIAGYASEDGLGVDQAWALAAGVVAAYVLSRGFAKAGSSEPDVRDIDVDAR